MRKLLLLLFLLIIPFIAVKSIYADEPKQVTIYFFWGEGCPHCAKEEKFLENLVSRYPEVKVIDYEVWGNKKNRDLMIEYGKKLNADVKGVPFTVIGQEYINGFLSDETTGKRIEDAVNKIRSKAIPDEIRVPILGSIKTKNLSLPVFTILLAGLDGFNPCAMWVLVFLISLLIGMHNKQRMWILGGTFILASAFVYFLFMAAWLNLILFIGFIVAIRSGIGVVAVLAGGYNLREYFVNKDAVCKVTKGEKKKKVFDSLKKITQEKHFLISFSGIIILAFAVNLVELICSAGFPVVFTQVLSLSHLSLWQYYVYLMLYIFVFMLDDLLVFVVAMKTMEITGVTTKYTRLSHLIGGILMVLIGLALLLKPDILSFG